MYPAERQAAILAIARVGNGEIQVGSLSDSLQVTAETIRRDLGVLERQGLISRRHGGAVLSQSAPFETALAQRQLKDAAQKSRIAARVVQELPEDGVVLIDSGYLTLEIAAQMPDDRDLIVVTNNLPAVQLLSTKPRLTVLALPGRVRNLTQGAVDEWTRQRLGSLNVDLAIIGANGLTLENGITTTIPDEAEVKRAMLLSGRRRLLALTSTKIGHSSFIHVADVDEFDMIVTDDGVDPEHARRLIATGPDLVIV